MFPPSDGFLAAEGEGEEGEGRAGRGGARGVKLPPPAPTPDILEGSYTNSFGEGAPISPLTPLPKA